MADALLAREVLDAEQVRRHRRRAAARRAEARRAGRGCLGRGNASAGQGAGAHGSLAQQADHPGMSTWLGSGPDAKSGSRPGPACLRRPCFVFPPRHSYLVPLPNGSGLALGERPLVMGVLNVTPDSFADAERFSRRNGDRCRARDGSGRRRHHRHWRRIDASWCGAVRDDEELRRILPVLRGSRRPAEDSALHRHLQGRCGELLPRSKVPSS